MDPFQLRFSQTPWTELQNIICYCIEGEKNTGEPRALVSCSDVQSGEAGEAVPVIMRRKRKEIIKLIFVLWSMLSMQFLCGS